MASSNLSVGMATAINSWHSCLAHTPPTGGAEDPPLYLEANWAKHKHWYAVVHRFAKDGNHLATDARSGGTTADGQGRAIEQAECALNAMVSSLGPLEVCDIRVRLFAVDMDGYQFGLIYVNENCDDPSSPSDTYECVMLEPNDIMFHPPWNSGEYST